MFRIDDLESVFEVRAAGERRLDLVTGISIDSRTLRPGELFFAVRGKRLDGHDFLHEASARGAAAFVVEKGSWDKAKAVLSRNIFLVENTTAALGRLARHWLNAHRVVRLGITGSTGKTTTKEMASVLLRRTSCVLATEGNLNNQFGLPLTLFRLMPRHEMVLAELGASRPGDIAYLAGILEPETGLITNIHKAHLGGFGSLDKIYEAKLELAASLAQRGGTLILGGDDPVLLAKAKAFLVKRVTYGRNPSNDFCLSGIVQDGETIRFKVNGKHSLALRTWALFNLDNFLAALVLANHMGISLKDLEGCVHEVGSTAGRFECHTLAGDVCVVHDAYNANPGSMLRSLESFASFKNGATRRIAVLGDMMELGAESEELHREVGRQITRLGMDMLLTVGDNSRELAYEAWRGKACPVIESFKTTDGVLAFLQEALRPGDAVLLKGSRSMRLEEVLAGLKEKHSNEPLLLS